MSAREFVLANKVEPPPRPTLAELEELLKQPVADTSVYIAPDGSVHADVPQWLVDYMEAYAAAEVKRVAGPLMEALEKARERFSRMSYACTLPSNEFERATRTVADEGLAQMDAALGGARAELEKR